MTRSNGQGDHASAVKKCRTADGLVGWWAGRHCRAPRIEAFYRSSLPRAPSVSNGQLGDIDDEGVYRDELFEEAQSVNDVEQGVLRLVLDQQRVKKRFSAGAIFGPSLMQLFSMLLPMSRVRARVSSMPVFAKASASRRSTGVLRHEAAIDIEWTLWDGAFRRSWRAARLLYAPKDLFYKAAQSLTRC